MADAVVEGRAIFEVNRVRTHLDVWIIARKLIAETPGGDGAFAVQKVCFREDEGSSTDRSNAAGFFPTCGDLRNEVFVVNTGLCTWTSSDDESVNGW